MKKILLVATGSVAVIKFKEIYEALAKDYEVKMIASEMVKQNYDCKDFNFEDENKELTGEPLHILHAKWADLIVVVPASANTISKFNAGIADNQVLSTLLAARNPILFVPAMNTFMYKAILERKIIDKLSGFGHMFLGPVKGWLWEKEVGLGRMMDVPTIIQTVKNYLSTDNKRKALVSIGASKVHIDPVRYITNGATGKFGKLIANELRLKGWDVEIIDAGDYTNIDLAKKVVEINPDLYISSAAIADYDIENFSSEKIKKNSMNQINLKTNLDVIEYIKSNSSIEVFGFKLDNDEQNAINKMNKNNLVGILWNKIGSQGSDSISGAIHAKGNRVEFNDESKVEVARKLAEVL